MLSANSSLTQYMIMEVTSDLTTSNVLATKVLHEKNPGEPEYEHRKKNLANARQMLRPLVPRRAKPYYIPLDKREGMGLELAAHLLPQIWSRYAVEYFDLDTGFPLIISDRSVNAYRFDTVGHFND